ncbi:sarcosine oxidase subunit gamma [Granulosicoccus sp. 3-233]|uniref:sarcosine oxidase subunit gamma n=1 Tax=Granulosicoccus sp. 3-233 TaxID=3417969 RepID=UPI003D340DAE
MKTSIADIVDSKSTAEQIEPTVLLEEAQLTGMLILRASAARDQLSAALRSVLELELPERLQSDARGAHFCVRWMSPDEWLLSCPIEQAYDIEKKLRAAITGHIAIVNVSGGYCLLTLSGVDAINVMRKSTSYNINPENFPPGKVVNTVMAKAQATLMKLDGDRYEVLVRRSLADYLWLWLQRAGKEYGLQAVVATA